LKESGRNVGQSEFARLQREALENYLIDLIRTVVSIIPSFVVPISDRRVQMFHPTSNRLAGFMEISALSISLAPSGGNQYKAGWLRIESTDNKKGFGRKSASWTERKKAKWCAVRESYLVAVSEAGEVSMNGMSALFLLSVS
jgi:phospholipase D1/2